MRRTLQSMIKPHVVRDMTLTSKSITFSCLFWNYFTNYHYIVKFGSIQVICNMHGSVTIGQLKLHLETVPELMMKNPHCKDTNADDSSFPAMIPIPAEIQRLIYSGRELQDSKTLDYYAIEESNFIFLVRYPSNYMPPLPMVGSSEEQKDPDMITTATETGATASLSPSDIPQQADQAAATESAMDISVASRAVHELLGVEAAPAQPDFTELLSSAQCNTPLPRSTAP